LPKSTVADGKGVTFRRLGIRSRKLKSLRARAGEKRGNVFVHGDRTAARNCSQEMRKSNKKKEEKERVANGNSGGIGHGASSI